MKLMTYPIFTPSFHIRLPQRFYWNLMLNWLELAGELQLKSKATLEECVMFGSPDHIPEEEKCMS